jgi:hypothetical protein
MSMIEHKELGVSSWYCDGHMHAWLGVFVGSAGMGLI